MEIKTGLLSAGMTEQEYQVIRTNILKLNEDIAKPKDDFERLEMLNLLLLRSWNNGSLAGLVKAFRGDTNKTLGAIV